MNSCVLMAKIVRNPQLRYTQDNQLAVTEMMVEFNNLSPHGQPYTLKVVSWGNLATEIEQQYTEGNQVILTGRLKMDTIDRPEGFKEKKAELTVYSIYSLDSESISSANVSEMGSSKSSPAQTAKNDSSQKSTTTETAEDSSELNSENLDNIPF